MLEPDRPHPARYWWLKRLAAGSALLALILALVRLGWGWEARRRLARELAPVVAADDPVTLADLPAGAVPDAGNGALVFRRAMADIGTESPSSSSMSWN